jgi:RimJ/RimL family protein N-acetyltransferase
VLVACAPTTLDTVRAMREAHVAEMACQVVHESLHARGWTHEYAITIDRALAGYGSIAMQGPWQGAPTVVEFHLVPACRTQSFAAFEALMAASGAVAIETQSNDAQLTTMLHAYATRVESERILFEWRAETSLAPRDASFRVATESDGLGVSAYDLPWHGVVTVAGEIVAHGGVLRHYNPPYGDVYMETAEAHRGRGYGAFAVQELARLCRAHGGKPVARCRTDNLASRATLQRAGFVPIGHMLVGRLEQA